MLLTQFSIRHIHNQNCGQCETDAFVDDSWVQTVMICYRSLMNIPVISGDETPFELREGVMPPPPSKLLTRTDEKIKFMEDFHPRHNDAGFMTCAVSCPCQPRFQWSHVAPLFTIVSVPQA